jgi:hypothetical protein
MPRARGAWLSGRQILFIAWAGSSVDYEVTFFHKGVNMESKSLRLVVMVSLCVCMLFPCASWAGSWDTATSGILSTTDSVGIGTAAPAARLDVRGNIRVADSTCSIVNNYDAKTASLIRSDLSGSIIYGWTKGVDIETTLPLNTQVGDSAHPRYIQGFYSMQKVTGGILYGDSFGLFGVSYATANGTIYGNSVSVYGQGAIAADGHVSGNLIGVYGDIYKTGGRVDGRRWAGYFNGNTCVNGYLGIGTEDPKATLDVSGNIWAKEIKVTTLAEVHDLKAAGSIDAREFKASDIQWSDFVFEDGYQLPSLDAVESYVRENRHLPGVPSAEQISREGLSMSDMMAKQMQKIEELTLYVIELKKQNEQLARESSELRNSMESLKKNF